MHAAMNSRFLAIALLLVSMIALEPCAGELRCQCVSTIQGVHPKNIQSVYIKTPGPHCSHTEVIATLKNGQKVCLNPDSPMAKKFVSTVKGKLNTAS
ncbi:truncated Rh158.3 [macacine betaherpesvirus 3]|nr:truncated Rh158.3 [macacine betaherpesvirus 3]